MKCLLPFCLALFVALHVVSSLHFWFWHFYLVCAFSAQTLLPVRSTCLPSSLVLGLSYGFGVIGTFGWRVGVLLLTAFCCCLHCILLTPFCIFHTYLLLLCMHCAFLSFHLLFAFLFCRFAFHKCIFHLRAFSTSIISSSVLTKDSYLPLYACKTSVFISLLSSFSPFFSNFLPHSLHACMLSLHCTAPSYYVPWALSTPSCAVTHISCPTLFLCVSIYTIFSVSSLSFYMHVSLCLSLYISPSFSSFPSFGGRKETGEGGGGGQGWTLCVWLVLTGKQRQREET